MLFTKFGNPAPNTQQIVPHEGGHLFTSYGTPIALKTADGDVVLYRHWNASQTTTYYRNQFLGENTEQTRRKIADGTYKMA